MLYVWSKQLSIINILIRILFLTISSKYNYVSSQTLHYPTRYRVNHRPKVSIVSEGRLRLVGGFKRYEGNVEIYHFGRWGSVCDDEWDINEAKVVCRSLGYSSDNTNPIPTINSRFGKGRKLIWMDNLFCNGNESSLDKCQFDGWKNHDCSSNEAAGVICKKRKKSFKGLNKLDSLVKFDNVQQKFQTFNINQIRIQGGRTAFEGRVEVKLGQDQIWRTICGNGWSLLESMVVCRSLGQGFGQFASIGEFTVGLDHEIPPLPGIQCKGYESSLSQCKARSDISTTCGQNNTNIAGVMCTKELPDLRPDEKAFGSSVYLEDRPLALLQCALEENCLASDAYTIDRSTSDWLFETRRLLRFTARIGNIGTADFIPFLPKRDWEWHSCHRHYHSMEVFAHFDLLNLDGKRVAEGHKASFCLEDNNCQPGSRRKYSCANYGDQGISVGCIDTYLANIDCQWIDITHLEPGLYHLKLSVNPEFKVSELSFDNNAALCNLYYDASSTKIWNCTLTRP